MLAVLKDFLSTIIQMHLLKPLLCPDATFDNGAHLVQDEGGEVS
jgi:hypothetical protein